MAVSIIQTHNLTGVTGTTATYTSISIGTATDSRIVVVCYGMEQTAQSATNVQIDWGTGTANLTSLASASSGILRGQLFYRQIATGTLATFTITNAANVLLSTAIRGGVYWVNNATTSISTSGLSTSTDMDATTPLTTGSREVPSGGGLLAVAACASGAITKTWTNATADMAFNTGLFGLNTGIKTTSGIATTSLQGTLNGEDGSMSWMIFAEAVSAATPILRSLPFVYQPLLVQ